MHIQYEKEQENCSYSLENVLANSIRRAKQKIFKMENSFNQSNLTPDTNQFSSRRKIDSKKNYSPIQPKEIYEVFKKKEEKSMIAAAIKTLQDKIQILQSDNKNLRDQNQYTNDQNDHANDQNQYSIDRNYHLSDKSSPISIENENNQDNQFKKRLLRQSNKELQEKILNLQMKFQELKLEVETKNTIIQQKIGQIHQKQTEIQILKQNMEKIQLKTFDEKQKLQLEQQNAKSESIIIKLSEKLKAQKQQNLAMIRMQKQNLLQNEQKQSHENGNNRNIHQDGIIKENKLLQTKNSELLYVLRKLQAENKLKQTEIRKQRDKYQTLNHTIEEIIRETTHVLPTIPTQLRYLFTRLDKINYKRISSFHSNSSNSKGSYGESSAKRGRLRSLKMQDLSNSKSKMSPYYRRSTSSNRTNRASNSSKKYHKQLEKKQQNKPLQIENISQIKNGEKKLKKLRKQYNDCIVRVQREKQQTQEDIHIMNAMVNEINLCSDELISLKKNHRGKQ